MPFYIFLWLRTLKKYIHQCLPANSWNLSLLRVNPYFCPAKDFQTMASTFRFLVLTLATTLVSTGEALLRKPLTWARPPSKGLAGLVYFSWKRIPMEERSNSLSHSPVLLFRRRPDSSGAVRKL